MKQQRQDTAQAKAICVACISSVVKRSSKDRIQQKQRQYSISVHFVSILDYESPLSSEAVKREYKGSKGNMCCISSVVKRSSKDRKQHKQRHDMFYTLFLNEAAKTEYNK